MAEWSNAAVLKTVVGQPTGGSNPSLSAKYSNKKHQNPVNQTFTGFFVLKMTKIYIYSQCCSELLVSTFIENQSAHQNAHNFLDISLFRG
jgi:hypothetical protein